MYVRESNFNVRYAAPEVLARQADGSTEAPLIDADMASDMYSLGVVMYEILSGNAPWGSTPDSAVCDAVAAGKGLQVISDGGDNVSMAVASMIEECLSMDSASRPSAAVLNARLLELAQ